MVNDQSRFLIAKFVPDLRRFEPRNIGVVLWAAGSVRARFLGEQDTSGKLDLRRVPISIDRRTYEQWVSYWHSAIRKSELQFIGTQEIGSVDSLRFLDALMSTGVGNFYFVEGGSLIDVVDDVDAATNFLFSELVAERAAGDIRESLEESCENLLKESGLKDSPYFRESFGLKVRVDGNPIELQFNYACVNGSPKRLYQRVPLIVERRADLQKAVLASAFMFEKASETFALSREQNAALVSCSDRVRMDSVVDEALRVLGAYARVMDVESDRAAVLSEFEIAAAL